MCLYALGRAEEAEESAARLVEEHGAQWNPFYAHAVFAACSVTDWP